MLTDSLIKLNTPLPSKLHNYTVKNEQSEHFRTIFRDQGYLSIQISNYIKHAPLRRLKRSGSLGLSENSFEI